MSEHRLTPEQQARWEAMEREFAEKKAKEEQVKEEEKKLGRKIFEELNSIDDETAFLEAVKTHTDKQKTITETVAVRPDCQTEKTFPNGNTYTLNVVTRPRYGDDTKPLEYNVVCYKQ